MPLLREVRPAQLRPVPRFAAHALLALFAAAFGFSPAIVSILMADRMSMLPGPVLEAPSAGEGVGSRSTGSNSILNLGAYDASGGQVSASLYNGGGVRFRDMRICDGDTGWCSDGRTLGDSSITDDFTALNLTGSITLGNATHEVVRLSPSPSDTITYRGDVVFDGDVIVHGRLRLVDDTGGEVSLQTRSVGGSGTASHRVRTVRQ